MEPMSEDAEQPLTRELFGSDLQETEVPSWNDLVSKRWQDLVRVGLSSDEKETLMKKYAVSDATAFLRAPQLNPECIAGLKSNSIVKRDEYLARNQGQVGVALCALGEAVSDLLGPAVQSLSQEARLAVAKVSDGAKILADLFYRISLSRRAQITPALNLTAKNTADTIPADEFLFGASFSEEIKKASALLKSSRDIVKAAPPILKKIQQPIKQAASHPGPSRSGNDRAPARTFRPATSRRAGASSNNRRTFHRSRSHSRRR